jgi:phage terminase large subunit-like protein
MDWSRQYINVRLRDGTVHRVNLEANMLLPSRPGDLHETPERRIQKVILRQRFCVSRGQAFPLFFQALTWKTAIQQMFPIVLLDRASAVYQMCFVICVYPLGAARVPPQRLFSDTITEPGRVWPERLKFTKTYEQARKIVDAVTAFYAWFTATYDQELYYNSITDARRGMHAGCVLFTELREKNMRNHLDRMALARGVKLAEIAECNKHILRVACFRCICRGRDKVAIVARPRIN